MRNPEPVQTKSAVNAVNNMPFRWSLNPYRGCTHACIYCYARTTHEYLGLDAGRDFQEKILYKANLVEVLDRELSRPRLRGQSIAIGTATDAYQPAEATLQITRRVLETCLRHGNPVSVTTKSPLVLRDLDVLGQLARGPGAVVHFSVASLDEVWRVLEPGTPSPRYRLKAMAKLRAAGVRAGVLMAPIVPGLTDGDGQMEAVVRAAAAAGASFVVPIVLRLQGSVREWFLDRLAEARPELAGRLATLYANDYAPRAYVTSIERKVARLRERYGIPSHQEPGPKAMPAPNGRWDRHAGTYAPARGGIVLEQVALNLS